MPHRLVPKPMLHRLGRRGSVLVLIGLAWLFQGLYLAISGPRPTKDVSLLHEELPHLLVGLLWVAFGSTAVGIGWLNQKYDHLGFLALSAMPLLYTGSYAVSSLTWVLTLGHYGWGWGLAGSGIWGCVCLLIGILAAWPEPPLVPPDHTDRGW